MAPCVKAAYEKGTNMSGSSRALAYTGAGTVTVAGIEFGQLWLVGIGVGLVVAGAILIRLGFRRSKTVGAR